METRWSGHHDQSSAIKRFRLCRNERMQRGAMGLALHVRKHLWCMKLCQRMHEETREMLWARARGGR